MPRIYELNDTIAAISTPSGVGGIGIVRVSGKNAFEVVDKIFKAKSGKTSSEFKTHTIHYGHIVTKEGVVIDEVLVSVMCAPKTYTCEDVVEINCHGGQVAAQTILDLLISSGARMAEPGEFTKRAFLNGRIDLTQAEAVLDIIRSKTDAFLKVSEGQLKGDLTIELETIRQLLMEQYVSLEAYINFPEDGIDEEKTEVIKKFLEQSQERIDSLLSSSNHGQILKEGIKVVICGRPNVGKSSLLNALLKHPRAIVSEIKGTTRDTIEEMAEIKGVPIQFVDTAGILDPRDTIEEEAVKRSHLYIEGADLILCMLDGSHAFDKEDADLLNKVKNRKIVVMINKSDLKQELDLNKIKETVPDADVMLISVLKNKGVGEIEDVVLSKVMDDTGVETRGIVLSNMRHIESLRECSSQLQEIMSSFDGSLSFEFISDTSK